LDLAPVRVRPLIAGEATPRFVLLLVAMFLELLLAPLLVSTAAGLVCGRLITGLVLLAALRVVGAGRVSVLLFAAAILAHGIASVSAAPHIEALSATLRLFFLWYVFALVVFHVLRDRNITYDTIAGAACGYMLIGLIWGELFIITQHWRPDSFEIPSSFIAGADPSGRAALMYFSFSTLTTVGYGEVHPNDPGAGGLAVSEAVLGQLYLAITISRLVGLHISESGK
jgi:voltage-gated potassium channel